MRSKKCVLGIVLAALFLGMTMTGSWITAAEAETMPLRVGYVDCKGLLTENGDGSESGYGTAYLDEIAKYTGWKYRYVKGSWEDCVARLNSGDLDLIINAGYSVGGSQYSGFSKHAIGEETSILYTLKENSTVCYNDFKMMEGKSFGVQENSTAATELSKYALKNFFSLHPVYYKNVGDMERALARGEIEFMADDSYALHDDLKVVGEYGSSSLLLMAQQGSELAEPLDDAIFAINTRKPYFEASLYYEYYKNNKEDSMPLFTREEEEFIKGSGMVTVGIVHDKKPLSYFDPKTGEASGINVEILQLIAKRSGLNFKYVPMEQNSSPIENLLKEKYDLVAGIVKSDELVRNQSLSVSSTTFRNYLIAVAEKGFVYTPDKNCIVAIPPNLRLTESQILDQIPQSKILYKDSNKDCMEAVRSGEADMVVQSAAVTNLLLQNPHYEKMEMLSLSLSYENDCIVGRSTNNPLLMSVINKTVDAIDREEISRILLKNTTGNPYEPSFADIVYKYRTIVAIAIVFMAILAVIISIMLRSKSRYFKELEGKNLQIAMAISRADKITALETDKMKISESPFDLEGLIGYISSCCYYKCREKNIDFKVTLNGVKGESLFGDQKKVSQIVFYLLTNSVNLTPNGGKIELYIKQKNAGDDKVILTVRIQDSGSIVNESVVDEITEAFERNKTVPECDEYGWGLFLASHLTEAMQGKLNIQNIPDKGTVAEVNLPFVISQRDKRLKLRDLQAMGIMSLEVESSREKEKVGAQQEKNDDEFEMSHVAFWMDDEEGYDFNHCRVLLAEDSEFYSDAVAELLEMVGILVETVSNGQDAIIKMEQSDRGYYDVLLVDADLPECDGYETARQIRALQHGDAQTICIIAMTTEVLSEDRKKLRNAGIDDSIAKPIDAVILYRLLKKYCIA